MINFWTKQDLKIAELIVANLDELHRRVTELEAEPTSDLKALAIALERIATVLEARLPYPFPLQTQYPSTSTSPRYPSLNPAPFAPAPYAPLNQINTATYPPPPTTWHNQSK